MEHGTRNKVLGGWCLVVVWSILSGTPHAQESIRDDRRASGGNARMSAVLPATTAFMLFGPRGAGPAALSRTRWATRVALDRGSGHHALSTRERKQSTLVIDL